MNTQEKIKILYVDDEQHNLNSFKATFRFSFQVYTALSSDLALEVLKKNPDIRVVLSDQRMPDKTGVQFFEEMRGLLPDPIRILITGYSDIESVIDAVNRGHIFRYIKKPWTDADVASAIDEANKFYITNTLLKERNEELQAAYDELDKFSYSITHDMRGPLLSVLGAMDIIKHLDDLNEVREILDLMGSTLNRLDDFIKSIHEYYKIKRGQLEFKEIDVNAIVNEVTDIFKVAGRMDQIEFKTSVEQHAPLICDEVSLKIILNNLLSNAFKYQQKSNEHKLVELTFNIEKEKTVIFVKDNGIGIPTEHIENIYKMFYRGTTQDSGSGFGLFIVKDSLEKINGAIDVQSVVNEGTTFKVTIPVKGNDTVK